MLNINPMIKAVAFCVLTLFAWPAAALTVPITAAFTPDAANPSAVRFKNTTPVTGICAHVQYSAFCRSKNLFSINTPILFNSTGPIVAHHTNPRQGAMLQVRSGWKDLPVTAATGETEILRFRITGISSTYKSPVPIYELVPGAISNLDAHQKLWGGGPQGDWNWAPRPCTETGSVAVPWPAQYLWFWLTPVDGLCAKTAYFDIPELQYYAFDFAYELQTPNPLGMTAGVYTGNLAIALGPGGDVDMGDVMLPDDSVIQLVFTLDVDHVFRVQIPPGGDAIDLVPEGGWQAWLQHRRTPERLFRDQTFSLGTSTAFKMQMLCSQPMGDTCGVSNSAGDKVPLKVSVTLPFGLTDPSGQGIRRRPLLMSGHGTEKFIPSQYIDHKPGTLHFEITKADVQDMLGRDNGTYSGTVTVIWDTEI